MIPTRFYAVPLALIGLLSACGEDPKPRTQAAAAPAPAATAPASPGVAADPMATRYEATLAEGIDFRKPGYPSFLAEVSGMSEREDWGRWTDGPAAKFRFKQPLPGKFTLVISAGTIGSNFGSPIVVRAGKVQKEFTISAATSATPPGLATFTLDFDGTDRPDTIEIIPPKPVRPKDINPKSDDARMLGVALVALKIQ